jgi:hypothetical protein
VKKNDLPEGRMAGDAPSAIIRNPRLVGPADSLENVSDNDCCKGEVI